MEKNNDLISRSALLEGLREYYGCMETCEECGCTAGKLIMNAPAVTEKAQWIPVTERLPEEDGYYLALERNGYFGKRHFFKNHPHRFIRTLPPETSITHWMPPPEPPKEE